MSERLALLRQCAAEDCPRLFLYGNIRRRWCDANTCGNRAKGRRYHDMVRRIHKRNAAMTPEELKEDSRRTMEALKAQAKKRAVRKKRLEEMLRELKADEAARTGRTDSGT